MATLPESIAETFLQKLAETKKLDETQLELLRELFAKEGKVKADELVKIFTQSVTGDVK